MYERIISILLIKDNIFQELKFGYPPILAKVVNSRRASKRNTARSSKKRNTRALMNYPEDGTFSNSALAGASEIAIISGY